MTDVLDALQPPKMTNQRKGLNRDFCAVREDHSTVNLGRDLDKYTVI
jgi:hypothetical protein